MTKFEIGQKYLITTDNWFIAPDGNQYRAAFGTVSGIFKDEEALNLRVNRASANFFVQIGDLGIAGCQIHYCIKTDYVSLSPALREIEFNGQLILQNEYQTRIYQADK